MKEKCLVRTQSIRIAAIMLLLSLTVLAPAQAASGPATALNPQSGRVTVYAPNPRYLQDAGGKPFVIIGSGNEGWNTAAVLDPMRGKVTYQRAYAAWWDRTESQDDSSAGSIPFPLVDGKADLAADRSQHWAWLRQYLGAAQERGIVVGLTLWDGHTELPGGKASANSIWHSQYNVQGVEWEYNTRALDAPDASGSNAQRAAYYQRRFVDTLMNVVKDYPNVLIELDNETSKAPVSWWRWWASYLKSRWGVVIATSWNATATVPDATFRSDPNFDMKSYHSNSSADVTRARHAYGKVIIADADNHCGDSDPDYARRQAWQSFARGGNWNDFVCSGVAFPNPAKLAYYGNLLSFIATTGLPFYDMTPSFTPYTTYAMIQRGAHYLTYLPNGGSTRVDLRGLPGSAPGTFVAQWYNPRDGLFSDAGTQPTGTLRAYTAPDHDDWVLYVHAER